ncbi:probable LRR receptor-like serine/threonine-protein kinase At3g47570 [Olea europaea var. sylvestris]|uniref:probable LRR receptor-like serine/threonine-protein kinase At3g47570 n=1 Tax=Olea europaea var. sylvestris TaxID=158386 RepID=UPI000C1D89BC|nr:probable LRR receptor-like serine/threonine-protein kinase At3g47570 [Olea europaea var. sylvestris]
MKLALLLSVKQITLMTKAFLFCLFLCFFLVPINSQNSNATDRLALLEFKSRITNDPFNFLNSWNESAHFCHWPGVVCSRRYQKITSLNLQHQKLTGSLSPYIGNLTFLHQLILDNNSFMGNIPQELGNLRRLRFLWLRNNSFDGEIPANLSACSNLVEIRLSWNNLYGKIPTELGSLSKLQLIQAPRNSLVGEIPSTFGNASSLEFFGFSSNRLAGRIPNEFGQLNRLEYIGLSENRLSGSLPPTIFNLSSITTIFVPMNQMQGTLPSYIGKTLPNLYYLGIAGNQFTGTIPVSLSNLSNLEFLFIGGNKLTGNMPSFSNLHKLSHLDISSNYLGNGESTDLIFISSLNNASNLEELGLSDNNFGGVLPKDFGNLSTKLTGILVSNNQLSGNLPSWIENFENLTNIEMRGNKFKGHIPIEIGKLRNLHILDLSHNNFSGKIPSFLGNLSLLTKLHLNDNSFYGEIPFSLGMCQNLQGLNLSKNNLNGTIPSQVFSLSSLSSYLDLSNNHLVGQLPTEVGNLDNLGELVISENKLSGEIPVTLSSCVRLEKLLMNKNFFRGTIPSSLSTLRGLRFLDLSQNNLSGTIPQFLGSFDLQYLNLSFNSFEGVLPNEGIFRNATTVSVIGNPNLCVNTPGLQIPLCENKPKPSQKFTSTLTFKLTISLVCSILGLLLLSAALLILYYSKKKRVPSSDFSEDTILKLSYQTLFQATDGFSSANLVGTGSFSSVYKGFLDGTETVLAVKVFDLFRRGASKSFLVECEAFRNIKHRNLVRVLTACSGIDNRGNDFKALVYEFMDNGNLDRWLHSSDDSSKLNVIQRLNIAIDITSALDYLHHHCHETIIHCDLKPSNVLLDNQMVGHVGDFGLAKFLPTDDQNTPTSSFGARGTIGYAAPEYGMGSQVSTLGDVYSFGILLLEMFTGKRPTDDMFKDGLSLHSFVKVALPDRVAEIIDPVLVEECKSVEMNTNYTKIHKLKECFVSVFEVGLACSMSTAKERLSMSDAAYELLSIRNTVLATGMYQ